MVVVQIQPCPGGGLHLGHLRPPKPRGVVVAHRERRVAVEINCDVIPRDRYIEQTLRAGDVVEIVQFVGGG